MRESVEQLKPKKAEISNARKPLTRCSDLHYFSVIGTSKAMDENSSSKFESRFEGHVPASLIRKLSLPIQTGSDATRNVRCRRNSDVGKLLSYYGEHLGHNNAQQRHKKSNGSKPPAFDIETADIYIPDVYLEAARSPGSLREELLQLQTIDKIWDSCEDLEDQFYYLEDFAVNKMTQSKGKPGI